MVRDEEPEVAEKARALATLRERAMRSERGGQGYVFGHGAPAARLVIVGEAPGPEEEKQGQPFVGRAGTVLDRLLKEAGLERDRVYVTNVVKRRPTRLVRGAPATRAPSPAEIAADLAILEDELKIIDPDVVVCMGIVPAKVLIGGEFRLSEQRGTLFPRVNGRHLLATFHPAYLRWHSVAERSRLLELIRSDLALAWATVLSG